MNFTADINAKDLVNIVKACGEAGVTDFQAGDISIKFKPRWVAEAESVAQAIKSEVVTKASEEREPLELSEPEEDEDSLMLINPVEWHRRGMEAVNG